MTISGGSTGGMTQTRVLVTGAGGFIGHHLVAYLERARLLGARRRYQAARVRS